MSSRLRKSAPSSLATGIHLSAAKTEATYERARLGLLFSQWTEQRLMAFDYPEERRTKGDARSLRSHDYTRGKRPHSWRTDSSVGSFSSKVSLTLARKYRRARLNASLESRMGCESFRHIKFKPHYIAWLIRAFFSASITLNLDRRTHRQDLEWVSFSERNPVPEQQVRVPMRFRIFADHDPAIACIFPRIRWHGFSRPSWVRFYP